MKRKLYTKSGDVGLLEKVDNNGGQFTAEEHAYIVENEYAYMFESKETLLHYYLSENSQKLSALGFLIKHVYEKQFTHICSLGAGQCVLEYLLKISLPNEVQVVAADFDTYFIDKARILLPDVIAVEFDFFKDDTSALLINTGIQFDMVVFWGSSYVMDDTVFVKLFQQLKEAGIKQIIDFHVDYLNNRDILRIFYQEFTLNLYRLAMRICPTLTKTIVPKIIGRVPLEVYGGKFHGYTRSRDELRRLYKKAGISSIRELRIPPYNYVAICDCEK
jgi:hypothetical protein